MAQQTHTERSIRPVRDAWPLSVFGPWRAFDELFHDGWGRRLVAVEEFTEDGTIVVKAELPGIDPDKDVEITVSDGMLNITAERSEEEEKTGRNFHRREFRYGSFARSLPIPQGVVQDQIHATYKDGILEVRVPVPEEKKAEGATRVRVTRG